MPDLSIHRALASAMHSSTPPSADSPHGDLTSRLQKVDLGHPDAPAASAPKVTPVDLGHPATPLPSDIHISGDDGSPVFDKAGRY